jgi:signal transduction histidine kinase
MTSHNKTPRILYIDDDPINRTLVNRLLSNLNFQVIEAETGIAGLQIAQRKPPDLILMDINMPGLDGHETTTRMRSLNGLQLTPIVALTANVTHGAKELALAAGCDGYIPKPIDVDHFPHQVIAYLEGQRDTISKDERQQYLGEYSQRLVERLEQKVLELEEANRRLQKIDKVKSDFITVAAHELRTPITLVYGYARLLHTRVKSEKISEPTPAVAKAGVGELSERIFSSVHRLSEVVNDILNIALIESNEMRLQYSKVHIGHIIKTALDELNPIKNDRSLTIKLDALDDLPVITGDAERLQQVFWNILSNAIKYTPDDGLVEVTGWLTSLPPGNAPKFKTSEQKSAQKWVVIKIKDSGIGIDPTEQEEIFDRFYVVGDTTYHSTSKTAFKGGGMGLGLPIARGIVEAHGGRVWVESAGAGQSRNSGSAFYILLPLNPEVPEAYRQ